MSTIALDLDGCLASFNVAYRRRLEAYGAVLAPFSGADPSVWDWPTLYGATPEQNDAAWASIRPPHHDCFEFWYTLPKHPDLTERALTILDSLTATPAHDVLIVTARPAGTWDATDAWVECHLGDYVRTVVTPVAPKAYGYAALGAAYVVEDNRANALDLAAMQTGATIYLIDRPYNAGTLPVQYGIQRVPSLEVALTQIEREVV